MNKLSEIPSTIEGAIEILYAAIDQEELEEIKKSTPEKYHHTVGRYLRNGWSFWEDSPLRQNFIQRFKLFGHGDDLSGAVLKGLYAKCLGEDINEAIQKQVDIQREHWSRWGLNPETGERVNEAPVNCIYYFDTENNRFGN